MIQMCIRMLQIPFEWFEFCFENFESISNGSNLHSNASNPLEWFECAFEWFESLSNGSNLASKALNPFRIVRICIGLFKIPFKWLEFAFVFLESLSNG